MDILRSWVEGMGEGRLGGRKRGKGEAETREEVPVGLGPRRALRGEGLPPALGYSQAPREGHPQATGCSGQDVCWRRGGGRAGTCPSHFSSLGQLVA